MVTAVIENSDAVLEFVGDHHDRYNIAMTPMQVRGAVVDSLSVSNITLRQDGVDVVYFNVYAKCPTSNMYGIEMWGSLLRGLEFISINGVAIQHAMFDCDCCKGVDHPTGLCPFSQLHAGPGNQFGGGNGGNGGGGNAQGGLANRGRSRGTGGPQRGGGYGGRGNGRGVGRGRGGRRF